MLYAKHLSQQSPLSSAEQNLATCLATRRSSGDFQCLPTSTVQDTSLKSAQETARANTRANTRLETQRPTLFSRMASTTRGTSAASAFFPPRVLFRRYSEDRNASVQLRLPVTRHIGPRLTMPRLVFPHPNFPLVPILVLWNRWPSSSPILFHGRFSLSSPALFPTTLHDACL